MKENIMGNRYTHWFWNSNFICWVVKKLGRMDTYLWTKQYGRSEAKCTQHTKQRYLMVFWNQKKEQEKDVRYAKIFWVIAIIVVCSIVIYSIWMGQK